MADVNLDNDVDRASDLDGDGEDRATPTGVVIAPSLYLTVTIELEGEAADVHLHPGGQGFWIARMIEVLGVDARLVAPIGGEAGDVVAALLPGWGINLTAVAAAINSPTQVHDRRSGTRCEIVGLQLPSLDRHGIDDFYAAALEAALASDALVLTSAGNDVFPDEAYARLLHDTRQQGVPVFADLHGSTLDVVLDAGPIEVLKVSEEDLIEDGWSMGSEREAITAVCALHDRGARTAVVSRAGEPALACTDGHVYRVRPPNLAVVDHKGAGDSMTAGMTVGHLLGLTPIEAVRLGSGAGAGNVTRRGLGSGRPELIAELSDLVTVEEVKR